MARVLAPACRLPRPATRRADPLLAGGSPATGLTGHLNASVAKVEAKVSEINTRLSAQQIDRLAKKAHQHAKGCKKSPQDCASCVANIEWFGNLSNQDINRVLSEKRVSR